MNAPKPKEQEKNLKNIKIDPTMPGESDMATMKAAQKEKDAKEIKHMSYECPGLHGPGS